MSCMCGDTHCWSCGPAQGNWRCPICRAWADDGCEHIGENGELRSEFIAQAEAIAAAEALADDQLTKALKDEKALAEAYWKEQS